MSIQSVHVVATARLCWWGHRFVECWSEELIRNDIPPVVVDDPLFPPGKLFRRQTRGWMKRIQKNDMTRVGAQQVKWDEDFFEKVFTESWQWISAVTGHQKTLVRFRVIAESLPSNEQFPGGTEHKKFGETRYGYKKYGETRYGSCPLMSKNRNRKFKYGLLLLKPTWSVESQDTCMIL